MSSLRNDDKECSRCGCWQPLDGFHLNRAAKDGRQTICKVCRCAESKNHRMRLKNPDQRVIAMNHRRPWLTVEESVLTKGYEKHGPAWCAVRVNRTADAVRWHWMAMRRRDRQ